MCFASLAESNGMIPLECITQHLTQRGPRYDGYGLIHMLLNHTCLFTTRGAPRLRPFCWPGSERNPKQVYKSTLIALSAWFEPVATASRPKQ